jgi:PhnB protein
LDALEMTDATLEPYIFFGGRCEEALEFYTMAIGAKVTFQMRYSQSPTPPMQPLPPGFENKIMHASVQIGEARLMASDGCTEGQAFSGFQLYLALADEAEASRVFAKLSEGGNIKLPIGKTFWSPCYGMLVDRFGVEWMVTVRA